jgi:hypothetical protein
LAPGLGSRIFNADSGTKRNLKKKTNRQAKTKPHDRRCPRHKKYIVIIKNSGFIYLLKILP